MAVQTATMALPVSGSVSSTVTSSSLERNGRRPGIAMQQQCMRCLPKSVLSLCHSPPRTVTRSQKPLPAFAPALLPSAVAPRGVACSARKPRWDSDDFAEQVADQVEENIRKAMFDARLDRSKAKPLDIEIDGDDIAARVAERIEKSIQATKERPGQTLFIAAAAVALGSAFIGPVIAALSIAAFFASISIFSSIALTVAFVSVGLAIPLTMFSVFGAFALPMLTPLVMTGALFWGARTFFGGSDRKGSDDDGQRGRSSRRARKTQAQKKETAEEREAREEAAELRKREREEEERQREIKEELKAFDELLKKEAREKGKN